MKKRIVFALILALLVSLSACAGSTPADTQPATDTTAAPTTIPETTVPETTAAPTEPPAQLRAGCYLLSQVSAYDTLMDDESVSALRSYIQILEDGTGLWSMSGAETEIQWDSTYLTAPGAQLEYLCDGDELIFSTGATNYIYTYSGTQVPEEYQVQIRFGTYAAGSVGASDGSITYFDTLDTANGYLVLKEDHTGYLSFDGKEGDIAWDDRCLYLGDTALQYIYYTEQFTGDGQPSILVGFPDTSTTVLFHCIPE